MGYKPHKCPLSERIIKKHRHVSIFLLLFFLCILFFFLNLKAKNSEICPTDLLNQTWDIDHLAQL